MIEIIKSDITRLEVDAIVNAANRTLMGGGGVDGAIHRAAGPKLLDECIEIRKKNYLKGLPTGEAVITKGYNLLAKYVIHTVGPIYGQDDLELLANCYYNSLKLAEENQCKSIAFPSISTGAYEVPIEIAVEIVKSVIDEYKGNLEIKFVLYNDNDYHIYKRTFK